MKFCILKNYYFDLKHNFCVKFAYYLYCYSMASDLEGLLLSLYDCILNTPENQRTPLADSLLKFGSKRPALLLSVSHAYLVQHNKVSEF